MLYINVFVYICTLSLLLALENIGTFNYEVIFLFYLFLYLPTRVNFKNSKFLHGKRYYVHSMLRAAL